MYDLSHGTDSVDFAGKTISLGADIDLSGRNWCAIDTFKGVFDGKGRITSYNVCYTKLLRLCWFV